MRDAAVPGYRLHKAKPSNKVLISLALVGVLFGLLSAVALTLMKSGVSPTSVRAYYLGSSDVLEGVDALMSSEPRPTSELAEITHLHLMGGSLLLFLLCHLLALCEISDRSRTILYVLTFGSFLLTFGSPWVIVFVSPLAAYIYGPSIISLIGLLVICSGVPLYEMWFRRAN